MARIVYAWELGAGYGHLAAFAPLGKALQDAGHQVTFVIHDLTHAETLLGQHQIPYLQAPVWQGSSPQINFPISYAEMLLSAGYHTPESLAELVCAWKALLDSLQADLLLLDHAPTALLATRGMPCRRMILGQGFFPPPALTPVPSIRPEMPISLEQLQNAELHTLAIINQVAQSIRQPPLKNLAELFRVEKTLICTFPELDWFPARPTSEYIGAALQLGDGVSFQWPEGDGPKVFAYLHSNPIMSERLLSALSKMPVRTVIHAPSLDAAIRQKYLKPNLQFSQQMLNMRQACSEADLAICNAGLGTTSAMLLAGKPMLLIPMQQEQFLLASAVARLGAAIMLPAPMPNPDYAQALQTLANSPGYAQAAQEFQKKYQGFSAARQTASLVALCTQMLA